MTRLLVPAAAFTLAALALARPAAAQDVGGLPLSPQARAVGGPTGLAKLLPFVPSGITAQDLQGGVSASDRTAAHQQMIARVRGDAGYLGGFTLGVPNSASVQPVAGQGIGGFGGHRHTHVTINNFDGPVAVTQGNGNVIQLQQASSATGPVALQQVGGQGAGGGATNVVGAGGNIVQRSIH